MINDTEETQSGSSFVFEGHISTTIGEVIVPVTVFVPGVFNGNLRDEEVTKKSVPHWEGVSIIIHKDEEGHMVHPPTGIVTSTDQVVGKVRDPYWDDDNKRIRANAHFSEELGAKPDFIKSVTEGRRYGVSSMYHRKVIDENGEVEGKHYDTRSVDILPNNLAIVDNPACPLNRCGINVEEKASLSLLNENIEKTNVVFSEGKNIGGYNMVDEAVKITTELVESMKSETEALKSAAIEAAKVAEIKDKEIVAWKAVVETNKATIDKLVVEGKEKDEKLATIATEAKKGMFLAKFPESNRKAAESELLPIFMESAEKMIVEQSDRYVELLGKSVALPVVSKGVGFVPALSEEEQEAAKLGLPTAEAMLAGMVTIAPKKGVA